jgi:hypothetical protein
MMAGRKTLLGTLRGIVEDGGEIVVMSLICVYAAALVLDSGWAKGSFT